MRLTTRLIVMALLTLSGVSSLARAQRGGRVEAVPFIGFYVPVATLIEVVDPGSGVGVKFEQQAAFSFGGRIGYWVTPRVAVEGAAGYTASDVKLTILGTGTPAVQSDGARVLGFSARARLRLRAGPAAFHLLGGVAVVSRYGSLWDLLAQSGIPVAGRTDVGALLGAGVAFPVCPGLEFRVEVEDYVHQAKFTVGGGANPPESTDARTQNDLVISTGLAIRLGRPQGVTPGSRRETALE